jgi:hypothetical protein
LHRGVEANEPEVTVDDDDPVRGSVEERGAGVPFALELGEVLESRRQARPFDLLFGEPVGETPQLSLAIHGVENERGDEAEQRDAQSSFREHIQRSAAALIPGGDEHENRRKAPQDGEGHGPQLPAGPLDLVLGGASRHGYRGPAMGSVRSTRIYRRSEWEHEAAGLGCVR